MCATNLESEIESAKWFSRAKGTKLTFTHSHSYSHSPILSRSLFLLLANNVKIKYPQTVPHIINFILILILSLGYQESYVKSKLRAASTAQRSAWPNISTGALCFILLCFYAAQHTARHRLHACTRYANRACSNRVKIKRVSVTRLVLLT